MIVAIDIKTLGFLVNYVRLTQKLFTGLKLMYLLSLCSSIEYDSLPSYEINHEEVPLWSNCPIFP